MATGAAYDTVSFTLHPGRVRGGEGENTMVVYDVAGNAKTV